MNDLENLAAGILRGGPVLVTGGGGFIGRNLIDRLVQIGADVAVLVKTPECRLAGLEQAVRIIECNLEWNEQLVAAVDQVRPTVVFHLAAKLASGVPDREMISSNIVGTANLLAAVEKHPLRCFVLPGSGFEYGPGGGLREDAPLRPNTIYGATKAAAHLLAQSLRRSRGLPAITLRLFTPYGPWEAPWRLVPFVACRAIDGEDIPLTEGRQERDYVYIGDVVDALIRAVALPARDDLEAVNICSGVPVTIRQMVSAIVDATGGSGRPQFGALPYREAELWLQSGDPGKAHEVLGWTASTSLAEGLKKTVDWIAQNRELLNVIR